MSSDGQTQSQLDKECEEMIKGSRIHLNPRMAELRRIVLFQLQKYSSWFPEKCTTTEESFYKVDYYSELSRESCQPISDRDA